jgi:hypothetical protein
VISTETSTERVRRYRQRQRDAERKLVRVYLPSDTASRLAQLSASGGPKYVEDMLAHAVEKAWLERAIADTARREPQLAAGKEPLLQTAGRRRSFAAAASSQGQVVESVTRNKQSLDK